MCGRCNGQVVPRTLWTDASSELSCLLNCQLNCELSNDNVSDADQANYAFVNVASVPSPGDRCWLTREMPSAMRFLESQSVTLLVFAQTSVSVFCVHGVVQCGSRRRLP